MSMRALQSHMRDEAAVRRVRELERAAHPLHRFLDDRQAQAGAGGRGARRVATKERRRQLADLLRIHALAGSRTLRMTHGPVRTQLTLTWATPVLVERP